MYPYYRISEYYKKEFGKKVYKIPISVAQSCPNREGLKGMETCIFCDEWGSAAYPQTRDLELKEQIETNKKTIQSKYKVENFLVYFQAYTNTFTKSRELIQWIDTALEVEGVRGIVIGTRPDCISQGVLNAWKELSQRTHVSIELGVQSFNDNHLEFMRRGHNNKQTLEAIDKISKIGDLPIGLHLMFGWPGETLDECRLAAATCNQLPIANVKLHNLHVLKNTPLASLYYNEKFTPVSLERYSEMVRAFLTHLKPDIAIHRLAAVASRWDELVAPQWSSYKMRSTQFIISDLNQHGEHQGCYLN